MTKLQCSLCPYHMIVSESLEAWAYQVMETHGAQRHPEVIKAAESTEKKEESTDEKID